MISANIFETGKENRKIHNCAYRNKSFAFEETISDERLIKKNKKMQKASKYFAINYHCKYIFFCRRPCVFSKILLRINSQNLFIRLPDEVILNVFAFIDYYEHQTLFLVCKEWKRLAENSMLKKNQLYLFYLLLVHSHK